MPVAEQSAALLHLAAAGVRAASGDPFWISPPETAHIRLTTSTIDPHADPLAGTLDLTELADLVAEATHAGTWSGHR